MNTAEPESEAPAEARPRSLFATLNRLGGLVNSKALDRGDRAELRRMRPDDIPPEVFWRLTSDAGGDDIFWITVLPLMVMFPHAPGARPGRVLAQHDVKAARIVRWLRRDRLSAWQEARRLLGPARGVGLDWGRLGTLMARWDDPEVKREFARDFFAELRRRERKAPQPSGDT